MHWKTAVLKRVVDVLGASTGLALTAPLFPVVAVAIKATSPGPVFYRQTRCGAERRSGLSPIQPPGPERRKTKGFHTFRMTKFRSMRVDAERFTGAVIAQENDPRLTPIGGLLRKSRLDELPQLWHVLKGDMSLVGPRPERPELMARIEASVPFFSERMRFIKPGITGLAQVKLNYDGSFAGRADTKALESFAADLDDAAQRNGHREAPANGLQTFSNKLLFDLAYSAILENPVQAMRTDLEVMLRTPLVMLRARGR